MWSEKIEKCTEKLIKIDAYWAIPLYVKKLQKSSLANLQNEPLNLQNVPLNLQNVPLNLQIRFLRKLAATP